jgi:hypothetical protein
MNFYTGNLHDLHVPNSVRNTYHTDLSKRNKYIFNEFGYRKSNTEMKQGYRVYTCGCSNTFGVGLNVEETWSFQMCSKLETKLNHPVALYNFSQGGASNDYIAKTLLMQASHAQPDLIVAMFTHMDRAEFNSSRLISENIGPWNKRAYSLDYFKGLTPEDAFIRSLKNMLVLQLFCMAHQIKVFIVWNEHSFIELPRFTSHPACRVFIDLLEQHYISSYGIFDEGVFKDFAIDEVHPGPITNMNMASILLEEIQERGIL